MKGFGDSDQVDEIIGGRRAFLHNDVDTIEGAIEMWMLENMRHNGLCNWTTQSEHVACGFPPCPHMWDIFP